MNKFENFRDYILEKEKEGKVIIATFEGFAEADLDEIIKQPTEGLLYDLNRDRATILTFIEDKKWVNDFACMKVIEKLKEREKAARKEGIRFTLDLMQKYGTAKTFQDRINKELNI